MGITLVPDWWAYVFTYSGDNHSLEGLLNAVNLVMENGFAVCAILGVILNLVIPDEPDDVPAVINSTESDDGQTQTVTPVTGSEGKMEQPMSK